jgi:hypothetical protein
MSSTLFNVDTLLLSDSSVFVELRLFIINYPLFLNILQHNLPIQDALFHTIKVEYADTTAGKNDRVYSVNARIFPTVLISLSSRAFHILG